MQHPFTRSLVANSSLAHSSGSAHGNALNHKQHRAQQNLLARNSSTASGKGLRHKQHRAQQYTLEQRKMFWSQKALRQNILASK